MGSCVSYYYRNCDVADYLWLKYMCNKFLLPRTLNCIPFAEAILVLYDVILLLSITTSKTTFGSPMYYESFSYDVNPPPFFNF